MRNEDLEDAQSDLSDSGEDSEQEPPDTVGFSIVEDLLIAVLDVNEIEASSTERPRPALRRAANARAPLPLPRADDRGT
jgi:hypothetical protein